MKAMAQGPCSSGGGGGITEVYTVQGGVAVLQQTFPDGSGGEPGSAKLFKNGTLFYHDLENDGFKYFHFEDGELKLTAILTDSYKDGMVHYTHILPDGSETVITWEEHWRLRQEYAGGSFDLADLDWHRIGKKIAEEEE
jgi:hypothetical protein